MIMPTENPRITFTVSEELKEQINEFQFSNRIKNQSQAILALIDKGMNKINESGHDDTHDLDQPRNLSPEAYRLARIYDALPDEHSKTLLMLVAEHERSRTGAPSARAIPVRDAVCDGTLEVKEAARRERMDAESSADLIPSPIPEE